jgi:hypothetical protein
MEPELKLAENKNNVFGKRAARASQLRGPKHIVKVMHLSFIFQQPTFLSY